MNETEMAENETQSMVPTDAPVVDESSASADVQLELPSDADDVAADAGADATEAPSSNVQVLEEAPAVSEELTEEVPTSETSEQLGAPVRSWWKRARAAYRSRG